MEEKQMRKKIFSVFTTLAMVISLAGVLPAVTVSAGGGYANLDIGESFTIDVTDMEMFGLQDTYGDEISYSNDESNIEMDCATITYSGGENGYFVIWATNIGYVNIKVYKTNGYVEEYPISISDYSSDDYYDDYYIELETGINTIYSSYTYHFTPTVSGVYYFECYDCNYEVCAEDHTSIYKDIYILPVCENYRQYNLEEGGEYEFAFSSDHDGHDIYFGIVDYQNLGNLDLGTTNVLVNNDLNIQTNYCFTPTQSGQYRITSNGTPSDPAVIITDENSNVYYWFDDTDDNVNYNEIIDLTANQDYYFSFYDYNGATNSNINISSIPQSNPTPTPTTRPPITNVNTTAKPIQKVNIKKVTKPGKPKIKYTVNPKTNKIKVKWKKVKGATGYQYKIALTKKFKKAKKKLINKKSFTYKLKFNQKYTIGVRAYKIVGNIMYYGKWTTKKIRLKKV